MSIYLVYEAQMALLLAKNVNIPKEYTNFSNVFFKEFTVVFFNHLDINKQTINLKPSKQTSYRLIYSLCPVELKTCKTYIKANFANKFI